MCGTGGLRYLGGRDYADLEDIARQLSSECDARQLQKCTKPQRKKMQALFDMPFVELGDATEQMKQHFRERLEARPHMVHSHTPCTFHSVHC